jgi:60 kDa SS-A/Ro ribonucleoprotein
MQPYDKILSTPVPQSKQQEPDQVPNNARGWGFQVNDWTQLSRFLILGTVGGTYYVGEQDLTKQNIEAVDRCIAEDPGRVATAIANISTAGRALKNDPAIFVLARMAVAGPQPKAHALSLLNTVCRIPTHLFHFMAYYEGLGGKWGRALRTAVGGWYTGRSPEQLAYHLVKYQSRDGWSNKDVIKLSHPVTEDPSKHYLFQRELGKEISAVPVAEVGNYIGAVESLHSDVPSLAGKIELITRHNLPREVIPTELLNERAVWEAMLPKMPITALIRNLGKLGSLGILGPMSKWNSVVIDKLTHIEALRKGRVHPLSMLIASKIYEQGQGLRGSLKWNPETSVVNALQDGFYACFGNVQPTGLRVLFALDESGSMRSPIAGDVPLECAEAGAAVLCVLNSVEPQCVTVNFATSIRRVIHDKRSKLVSVMREYRGIGEGTDCAKPFDYALVHYIPVDLFVIFTDSETWAGHNHPHRALDRYRASAGIPSKVVVCAAAVNKISIFRDNDPLVLNVPGFDAALPQIIREFASL